MRTRFSLFSFPTPNTHSAGHPGEFDVGNWILLAQCKQKLSIPYIVSGGCANGSQLAAALTLGAQGMNMGTRFMATKEGMFSIIISDFIPSSTIPFQLGAVVLLCAFACEIVAITEFFSFQLEIRPIN